jgi:hypothetical protein
MLQVQHRSPILQPPLRRGCFILNARHLDAGARLNKQERFPKNNDRC